MAIIATLGGLPVSAFVPRNPLFGSRKCPNTNLRDTSFGFDISSMCAIVVQKQYLEYFESPAGVVQGAIDSVLAAGSVVGSAVAGPLSDNLGRRDAVAVACIFWLIGTSVQVST